MDSSEQVEDDTIRDQMESGYTATRPRFTRARRTWNLNLRYLTAEDVRAIRTFRDITVLRGALPFYFPNLIENGGFEILAGISSVEIVKGWSTSENSAHVSFGTVGLHGSADPRIAPGTSGNVCIEVAATGGGTGTLSSNRQFSCMSGDVLLVSASTSNNGGTIGLITALVQVSLAYQDTTENTVSEPLIVTTSGWGLTSAQLTIPAPVAGGYNVPAIATVSLEIIAASEATASTLLIDDVGVAKISSAIDGIEMTGSAPIPAQVRFASGALPQFSDLGWVGGQKRYGCTFKLEEL
jgi:hypothetical protein